jgi:hypothetical protein
MKGTAAIINGTKSVSAILAGIILPPNATMLDEKATISTIIA